MFQLLATVFFTFALIAPLAVVILTLHANWGKIVGALTGARPAQTIGPVVRNQSSCEANVNSGYRLVIRPARYSRAPLRAAA